MAETLAATLLQSKGYTIIERNKRSHYGEIDILALDKKTLVVVEVKAKTSDTQGLAIEMITPVKQRKLILLTAELQAQKQYESVRIDVVTVDNASSDRPVIKHHKGIIESHG